MVSWDVFGFVKKGDSLFMIQADDIQNDQDLDRQILLKVNNDNGSTAEMKVTIPSTVPLDKKQKLYVSFIKENLQHFLIYIRFDRFIIVFHYDKGQNAVTYNTVFPGEIHLKKVLYSEIRDIFLFNDRHFLYIFDNKLGQKIHQVDIEDRFRLSYLSHNDEYVVLCSQKEFLELSLLNFEPRKKIGYFDTKTDFATQVLDKEDLPWGTAVTDFCAQEAGRETRLAVYEQFDFMNLEQFPFLALAACFNKNNYRRSVREYSRYYFSLIGKNNNFDNIYGPLNPQLMFVYHNDYAGLQENLEEFGYVSNHQSYVSPLEYCFMLNYYNCTRIICEFLVRNPGSISLSRRDLHNLLGSKFVYCHKLLGALFRKQEDVPLPKMVYMSKGYQVHADRDYLQVGNRILDRDARKKQRIFDALNSRKKSEVALSDEEADNVDNVLCWDHCESGRGWTHKTEVEVFCPEVPLDLSAGSPDSIRFLENFSETPSADFLTSNWQFLLFEKWASFRFVYFFLLVNFYTFNCLFTLSTVFFKDNQLLRYATFCPIALNFLFEFVEFVSFMNFRPKRYFREFTNVFDLLALTGSTIYLLLFSAENQGRDWFKVTGLLIHFVVFYRGFNYLKIFDTFRTNVKMINIIIFKIYAFMAIMLYFYLVIVVLMIDLTSPEDTVGHVRNVYFWVLFGGIEDSSFEVRLSFIVIFLGTMLISVILLNILIAYLSNLFSSLEEKQVLENLREKAGLVLGIEVIVRLFKFALPSRLKRIRDAERFNFSQLLSNQTLGSKDFQVGSLF